MPNQSDQTQDTLPQQVLYAVYFLALIVLAFGTQINRLGFYLDDWYIVFDQKVLGSGAFHQFFLGDRPLFKYLYQIFVPIFEDSAISWQVFALFMRWVAVFLFYKLVRLLLPKAKLLAFFLTTFFAIYPAFIFHWFAVMFSQVYVLLTIYFISYILMIVSLRSRNGYWLYTLPALVLAFMGIAPIEYFFGLELVRPLLIWKVLSDHAKGESVHPKQVMVYWLPYLLVFLGFGAYRVITTSRYSYQMNLFSELQAAPFNTLLHLMLKVATALYEGLLKVWVQVLDFPRSELAGINLPLFLLSVIGCGILAYLFLFFVLRRNPSQSSDKFPLILAAFGFFAAIVSMIPVVVGGFAINLSFANNRFYLAMSPGLACIMSSALFYFLRTDKQRILVLALLVTSAAATLFVEAHQFALAWQDQKALISQITWRIPQLEPGTALMTDDLYFSQYAYGGTISHPLNLAYAPDLDSSPVPYYLFLTDTPQIKSVGELVSGRNINPRLRAAIFEGSTDHLIAFDYPRGNCLHIIGPEDTPELFETRRDPAAWQAMLSLNNLERIISDPSQTAILPTEYYGLEDRNQWCFYYAKAELAAQQGNWTEVTEWYSKAKIEGFQPSRNEEYRPLLAAYLNTGRLQEAIRLTEAILVERNAGRNALCKTWQLYAFDPDLHLNQGEVELFLYLMRCPEKR